MTPDETYQKQVLAFSARMRRELAGEVSSEGTRVSSARRAAERRREQALDRRRTQATRSPTLKGALREEVVRRSDTTTLMALARRGVDQVTVLPMRAMEEIVRESVDQALAARGVGAGEDRDQLAADARRRLGKLLRSRRRVQVAKAEEERRRRALEGRVRELTQQFSSVQADLSAARETGVGSSSVAQAVRGVLEAQGLGGSQAEALERQLTQALQHAQQKTRSDNEELLEKRLVKVNRALEESEQALRTLASMKSIDPGVGSIYDCVQGLSSDEDDAERKKELLALVFEDNCALQLSEEPEPVAIGASSEDLVCSESAF